MSIVSPDNGIVATKPNYQDPLIDTFMELMASISNLLEEQFSSNKLNGKDYADVYKSAMLNAMGVSAQLAKDSTEQDYRLANILPLQVTQINKQIEQIDAQILFQKTQKAQIEQSVYDNRQIKVMDSLANMTGMILNGGTQTVPADLATSLANAITNISEVPKQVIS